MAGRLVPSSAAARPYLLSQAGLLVLAGGSGVATQAGALDAIGAVISISLIAAGQLLGAWFQFRWWRSRGLVRGAS